MRYFKEMIYRVYTPIAHFPKWFTKPPKFYLGCDLHLTQGVPSSFQLLQAIRFENVCRVCGLECIQWSERQSAVRARVDTSTASEHPGISDRTVACRAVSRRITWGNVNSSISLSFPPCLLPSLFFPSTVTLSLFFFNRKFSVLKKYSSRKVKLKNLVTSNPTVHNQIL